MRKIVVPLVIQVLAAAVNPVTAVTVDTVVGFSSDRDGDHEIYFMNPDGSTVQQLTHNTSDEFMMTCSPDGARIVFVSDRDGNHEIYVMNKDGSGLTRLTNHPADDLGPAWSPCGTRILFSSDRDGDREIFVMDRDGDGLVQLTYNGANDDFQDWSPDGTRIVFQSDRSGSSDIWVMDSDGTTPQNLTSGVGRNFMPDWSPNGAKIVFESDRHGPLELYTMNADGSDVQRLTFMNSDCHEPDWSPDGSEVLFVSLVAGNYEVMAIDADGGDLRNLSLNAATDWGPSWRLVVPPFLGQDLPGKDPVRFVPDSLAATDSLFWHGTPVFSPAMHEMHWAYYAIHPGHQGVELYSMGIEMGHWTTPQNPVFADTDYGENNPFFSPSGDTLYFVSHRPGGFIFRTCRTSTGWSSPDPLNIPLPPGSATGWQFSMARNGNLYFEIWSNNGANPPDLYLTRRFGGVYLYPEYLGTVNSTYNEITPFIDPDEEYLIFASNRPGGLGFHDLYISFRDNDAWTQPMHMGPTLNSGTEDVSPYVSPDGAYLFFQTQKVGDLGFNPYWCTTEIIDSLHVPVPTQLAFFSVRPAGSGVEIAWRLAEYEPGSWFRVSRAPAGTRSYLELEGVDIRRDGLSFHTTDATIHPGLVYRYLVEVTDRSGPRFLFETDPVVAPASAPTLHQNYPNPFNPTTTISFTLPVRTQVNLSIYDVNGTLVRTLVDRPLDRGFNEYVWDGKDVGGNVVGSGVYFCRLRAGKKSVTRKMLLVK